MKRERRRTAADFLAMEYYAFGGRCYHKLVIGTGRGSRTRCGHRIVHIHDNPQRVWRGAPEWATRIDYRPCKVCYGKNYRYIRAGST